MPSGAPELWAVTAHCKVLLPFTYPVWRKRMNYTYLLRCADDSLYCGWTNHLEQRIKMHNSGKGAKYTKSRRPVALAYFEAWNTKEEAMKREAAIKKMTKNKKEALAAELRIIISPAKKMQVRTDYLPWKTCLFFGQDAGAERKAAVLFRAGIEKAFFGK